MNTRRPWGKFPLKDERVANRRLYVTNKISLWLTKMFFVILIRSRSSSWLKKHHHLHTHLGYLRRAHESISIVIPNSFFTFKLRFFYLTILILQLQKCFFFVKSDSSKFHSYCEQQGSVSTWKSFQENFYDLGGCFNGQMRLMFVRNVVQTS